MNMATILILELAQSSQTSSKVMFLLYISVISLQSLPSEELISPFIHKRNASLIFKFKKH